MQVDMNRNNNYSNKNNYQQSSAHLLKIHIAQSVKELMNGDGWLCLWTVCGSDRGLWL